MLPETQRRIKRPVDTGMRYPCAMRRAPLDIDQWLKTPLGECLVEAEKQELEARVSQFFGFELLQVGDWGALQSVRAKALTRNAVLVSARMAPGVQIVSAASRLAIASDTVDGVILPHTLEFDGEPHMVLREAERILAGEGKLAILGFNPVSFWGARRLFGTRRFLPGLKHMLSRRRICDWLSLLSFEITETRNFFYRIPINHRGILERGAAYEKLGARCGPLLNGVYLIMARKCVYSAVPPRAARVMKKRVVGGLVEPTSRNRA